MLKEISPEYSLEGLALTLKLQHSGHLMRRDDSLEKTLMPGKTEGRKRRGGQRMQWLAVITDSMDMSLRKLQELVKVRKPGVLQSTGLQRVGHNRVAEQQMGANAGPAWRLERAWDQRPLPSSPVTGLGLAHSSGRRWQRGPWSRAAWLCPGCD